jgi:hypothetical protein
MKIVKNEFYKIVDIFGNNKECLVVSLKKGEFVKIIEPNDNFPVRLTYPYNYIKKADVMSFFEISKFISTDVKEIREAIMKRINKESKRAEV